MQRIKRLVRPDTQALNWKAALPAIGLAAACLAGCAQTVVADPAPNESVASASTSAATTRAIANFASCAKPVYPAEALANKVAGTVTLGYLVGTDGSVRDSAVRKSSGDRSLDETARVAIAKCSFSPALRNGKPVEKWETVQYVWAYD